MSMAVFRPSQMFVERKGTREDTVDLALALFAVVMRTFDRRALAVSVKVTIERRSLGARRLIVVIAACFVTSRIERPVDSVDVEVVAALPMEPDTSITRTQWVGVRVVFVDEGGVMVREMGMEDSWVG
jgi:hypothetical protein